MFVRIVFVRVVFDRLIKTSGLRILRKTSCRYMYVRIYMLGLNAGDRRMYQNLSFFLLRILLYKHEQTKVRISVPSSGYTLPYYWHVVIRSGVVYYGNSVRCWNKMTAQEDFCCFRKIIIVYRYRNTRRIIRSGSKFIRLRVYECTSKWHRVPNASNRTDPRKSILARRDFLFFIFSGYQIRSTPCRTECTNNASLRMNIEAL